MDEHKNRYKYIFDEILSITDDGFIVIDTKGIITDINMQYCNFLGTTREEAIGQSIKKFISNTKMLDIVNNAYSEKVAIHKFMPGETKESDDSFLLVSRSCVFDENKEVIAGVAQVKFRLQTLDSAKKLMNEYSELEFYKEEYRNTNSNNFYFDTMIGSDPLFVEIKKVGMKASKTSFPVFITGETGTGKEVFARAIHNSSNRSKKPMVSINCAAIPSELLESELFGYEEGSFTGAKRGGKKGKFELADGGTIFLDEIGDMPLNMQAKLLRVLQEKEVEKIGAYKPKEINVRVIAATRRNVPQMIENGEFREDLYYRLNVINIEIIPLRKRKEDIVAFATYFLNKLNLEYKTTISYAKEVLECFREYSWPGNVRELDNVIKSAYAACDDFFIELSDLPTKMVSGHQIDHNGKKLSQMMESFERNVITECLRKNNGNAQNTAEDLGIHRSALYKKLTKLNIELK